MIPVLICGGVGTKMWPESRKATPKHFLPLINGKSLFRLNLDDLLLKFAPKDIFVSTLQVQANIVKAIAPELPLENFILEPIGKNQGPATGLVAVELAKRGFGDEPFMLIQVDDLRKPSDKFFAMMDVCDALARTTTKYITGGMLAPKIIRGVDFLVKGPEVVNKNGVSVYEVAKYIAREEEEEITTLFAQGKLLLHTNHTCMTPNNLLAMLAKYKPEWSKEAIEGNYAALPAGPIEDITKQCHANGESLMVQLPFDWVDIGTWESLIDYLPEQTNKAFNIKATGNYFRSNNKQKIVSFIGVDDLLIIDTQDAILIAKKGQSSKVGDIVKHLEQEGHGDYL